MYFYFFFFTQTHAFVKRDVPSAADVQSQLESVKNQFEELTKSLADQAQKALDPEQIKKNFDEFVDKAYTAVRIITENHLYLTISSSGVTQKFDE